MSSSDSCELTDRGRAFSTILAAFFGSFINGLNNGYMVAFITAWICWFAVLRISYVSVKGLIVSVCGGAFGARQPYLAETHQAVPSEDVDDGMALAGFASRPGQSAYWTADEENSLHQPEMAATGPKSRPTAHVRVPPGDHEDGSGSYTSYTPGPVQHGPNTQRPSPAQTANMPYLAQFTRRDDEKVDFFGWVAWFYAFLWTPVNHTLWIVNNYKAGALLHFARAVTIGVSALPYTIDTQARYGAALGRRFNNDTWIPRLFSIITAFSNCILSADVLVLLLRIATQKAQPDAIEQELTPGEPGLAVPIMFLVAYPIFAIIWAFASFKFTKPEDAGWKQTWCGRITGCLMGIFGGAVIAAPAFAVMQSGFAALEDSSTPAAELAAYLKCDSVAWWQKAVQVLP